MKRYAIITLIWLITSLSYSAEQQFAQLGDFSLEKGGTIIDCRIGFRTVGILNRDSSNVILYPTWFGGVSADILYLLKPDKLVDPKGYFIIIVDALGNGISSSPSNSKTQPKGKFPEFTIGDMVETQYFLLTKVLKLRYIHAIIGGSMGSMQAFEWSVRYPEFMDKVIPYVCSPQLQTPDLLLLSTELEIIESGLKCGETEEEILSELHAIQGLVSRTPEYLAENICPEEFPVYLEKLRSGRGNLTVYDWRSQLLAMLGHDIFRNYNNSREETAAKIKADMLIIVSATDHILNPKPALELADLLNAETLILQNSCGHLGVGCEIDVVRKKVMEFLKSGSFNH